MIIKSIKLETFAHRSILFVVGLLCILAVYFAVKWCLANALASQAEYIEAVEFASDLAPDDPITHQSLAILLESTFLPKNFSKALEEYEKAASLAPNDYRSWYNLGRARERNGDSEGAEKALRKALELGPNYSQTHWTLGNLLLRRGKTEEAFVEIYKAVEGDANYANPAVTVVWQFFDGDVSLISQKIGDSNPIKSALSAYLGKQKRFDEAFAFWNSLPAEEKKATYRANSEELLRALLEAKKYRDAFVVQSQISPTGGESFELGKIFNAGFETDVKAANANIFDWKIADGLQPQIGYDNQQKRDGNRSLVIVFDSPTGKDFRAIEQTVAVEGEKRYRFETFSRAALKSSATVKWEIVDAVDGKVLASTDAVANNSDWAPLTVEFTTAPTTQAVTIQLARVACKTSLCPISGKVWFDGFNLRKSE